MQSPNFLSNIIFLENIAACATQKAAIACFDFIGSLDEEMADWAAVNAMRCFLNDAKIDASISIGEGERDNAPMLYQGEKLGAGGIDIDIAVDPLEGTTICAEGGAGAISVIVFGPRNSLLKAPDLYMEKIAVGIDCAIDLDNSIEENLNILAIAKKCHVSELCVTILKRPRHKELIESVKAMWAKVKLITDGDIIGAASAAFFQDATDMYIGIGGAPEGIIAASIMKCLGGTMQGRLIYDSKSSAKIEKSQKYSIDQMVSSDVIIAMTGVTDGHLLRGVKKYTKNNKSYIAYETIIFSSYTKCHSRNRIVQCMI